MPIIIRAKKSDSVFDIIKRFKKAVTQTDIVQTAKDRMYFVKPSKKRAVKKIEMKRLRRRARSLKRMKNVSPVVLQRIKERLS
ncbi:MAG: 30S ribosomal protein S21 [Candidatus Pacebacteria bacterium]|nr:30S ribosomal protein S21 [Candidatus Paceibacterota bacterium]PIR60610.1 MAG: 30S ribosomal protein S21 [Candidatus Pacebacteria bacterium CG10_big_fil_rev_8_21_14_0_10_44_54]